MKLPLRAEYSTHLYNLREYVREGLNVYNLEEIKLETDLVTEKTDQSTLLHRKWYNFVDGPRGASFLAHYKNLVEFIVITGFFRRW